MIDTIWQDLKYAARSLRRTPGFTAAAMVTLSLGIGANTAIFTLLDAVMFKPLNVPASEDLVTLYEQPREGDPDTTGGAGRYLRFSYPRFERLRAAVGSAGSLAAMTRTSTLVVRFPGQRQAESVRAQLISGEYFATLEVPMAKGRSIGADDVRLAGAAPVAVIGDRLWKQRLGVRRSRSVIRQRRPPPSSESRPRIHRRLERRAGRPVAAADDAAGAAVPEQRQLVIHEPRRRRGAEALIPRVAARHADDARLAAGPGASDAPLHKPT